MKKDAILTRHDLLTAFARSDTVCERVGVEIEVGTVDPSSGRSLAYTGQPGVKVFLEALAEQLRGTAIVEAGNIVGVDLGDGGKISIEHHGAMELSSPPYRNVGEAFPRIVECLRRCAAVASPLGIALLTGGNLPFSTFKDVHWMPLLRGSIMRSHLASLGVKGSLGKSIMGFALSTQTTLDYLNDEDLARKLRMLVAVSPVAGALFANSPLESGRVSGVCSRRLQYWEKFDPARCGPLSPALQERMTLDDFVNWALDRPMIFRDTPQGCHRAPQVPFADLLARGFPNGGHPSFDDWRSHLSQLYTDVRLRDTIEMRVIDGQHLRGIGASMAFWVGLAYDESACSAAWGLVKEASPASYQRARREAAIRGLNAQYGARPMRELALELIRLARRGLQARVRAGLEPDFVVHLLEPLEEIVESGQTSAERCVDRWQGEWRRDPAKYVRAFEIRADMPSPG